MGIKAIVDSWDEIPEQYQDLYEERGGKVQLTKVEGIKTDADVNRIQRSLEQEREQHQETQQKLKKVVGDKDPDEVRQQLDKIPELEAAAKGNNNEDFNEKVEEAVQARLQREKAPIERERDQLKEQVQERDQKVEEFQKKEKQRTIQDQVREAAQKQGLRDSAVDDALLVGENMLDLDDEGNVVTKDGVGVTPGVGPEVMLQEMQDKRPHWWPESQGGGAKGSGHGGGTGKNPFTAENWNMTKQAEVYKQDPEKAKQMAESAGTQIGGPKPQPKEK